MKVKDIINDIHSNTPWVNYNNTRDRILVGNEENEVHKLGVCWVATKKVLEEVKKQGIDFIISHENFLYVEGTHIYTGYFNAKQEKIKFCLENNITVYRLHDGWDLFPEYGVADRLSKAIGIKFEPREIKNFIQIANINKSMTIEQVGQKIADGLSSYGCDHVDILGNKDQLVDKLAIGVGAATDLASMELMGADAFVLADDGSNNWIEQQYCLDKNIPIILFHHSTNEMAGIDGMKDYFSNKYKDLEVIRLSEGYEYTLVKANNE